MTKVQELFDKLIAQYQQKNLAYGNNAHKTFVRFGRAAYSMRLMDKMQRYETLTSNAEISSADESILDTLGDAITYILMFAGDLFCGGDIDDDSNYVKTLEYMYMFGASALEDIQMMSELFVETWMSDGGSLSDAVYRLYSEKYASITDYILFAAHMINVYMEETK